MPENTLYWYKKQKELDNVFSMKKFRQKRHTKNSIKDIDQKMIEEENCSKTQAYDWIWPVSSLQHKVFGSQKKIKQ